MSKATILGKVEIPESAREPKRWFKERPGQDIVREVKEFVAQTGKPYLWRGHTHTKPAQSANVRYIGEFDLPASCKYRRRWAPCPCCWPNHPKYRTGGKIAWFPDECVIRLIGPDCFEALNPEGHRTALAEFRAEQQRERDIAYLLDNLPVVPGAVAAIKAAIPVAQAVDEFRAALRSRLDNTLQMPLWREIANGELRLSVRRREIFRRRDGSEGERQVNDLKLYATVRGVSLVNPRSQRFAPRLETAAQNLTAIQLADHQRTVGRMSDTQRRQVAKTLARNVGRAQQVFEELDEARRFASRTTVATLRNWGRQEGAPFPLYVARSGNGFCIGSNQEQQLYIELDPAFDSELPTLPLLGETKV